MLNFSNSIALMLVLLSLNVFCAAMSKDQNILQQAKLSSEPKMARKIKRHYAPGNVCVDHPPAVVRFTVAKDGSLSEQLLVRSSGYAMVDAAAKKAVRDAAPYDKPGEFEVRFTLPILMVSRVAAKAPRT